MKATKGMAYIYRKMMVKSAKSLDDADAMSAPMLFERWSGDGVAYTAGERVYYYGDLYKVLIDHVSQPAWAPEAAPSIFAKVLIPDPSVIPEWEQPESTNPYMKGDKVRHNGKTWICVIDYNVWEPGVYGWDEIEE